MNKTRALICVDVQNDFCEGGNLAVAGGGDVARRVAEMIETSWDEYGAIAFTQDWHVNPGTHFALRDDPNYIDTWPVHCVAGTAGARLHIRLREVLQKIPYAVQADRIETFKKGRNTAAYSGFEGTNSHNVGLEIWLRSRGITEVDIVGIAFDYCVRMTAYDAVQLGFRTTVARYLTASVDPSDDALVQQAMRNRGVEVTA